jgi:copper resistance protein B
MMAAALQSSPALLAQPVVDHSQHVMPTPAPSVDQSRAGPLPQGGRDPHAYSGGYQRGAGLHALEQGHDQLHMMDTHRFSALIVDQLERFESDGADVGAYDMQAWISQGFQRLTVKAEGEIAHGRLEDSRTELLWGKALSPYWDTQIGVRHDTANDARATPARNWVALGLQGLAPYWFEIDATAYLGSGGQTSLRLDAEYDLLLTQKLILQPAAELTLYGSNDSKRGLGSGLAGTTVGVRLRYEFSRQFAPYIGVERTTSFGKTADFVRRAGGDVRDGQWVAGVRFWF